jgi:hypothetical protein
MFLPDSSRLNYLKNTWYKFYSHRYYFVFVPCRELISVISTTILTSYALERVDEGWGSKR